MTAVDHAELKRLAEAATPKVWKPFWGDAVQAVMCARTDKEVVFWSGFDASRTATTKAKKVALMNFIAAANPAVVLELLSEIEGWEEAYDRSTRLHTGTCQELIAAQSKIDGLKAERDDWRSRSEAGDRIIAQQSACADEQAALRTQAPDSWRPDREAVAAIINPWAFSDDWGLMGRPESACFKALTKADAILALRPQTAESGA